MAEKKFSEFLPGDPNEANAQVVGIDGITLDNARFPASGFKGDKGDTGDTGPEGPTAVSTDIPNWASLGTDNLLMVSPVALEDLTDVDATPPGDFFVLTWDEIANTWLPKRSTSALGIVQFSYRVNTVPTTVPTTGRVSRNGVIPVDTTEVYINEVDSNGNDNTLFYQEITAGDWLNVYDRTNSDNAEQYDVTGPAVQFADVWHIPVALFAVIGAALTNNQQVSVFWRKQGSPNAYLPLTGGTMEGTLNMGANAITNATTIDITGIGTQVGAPAAPNDLVNKAYGDANYLGGGGDFLPLAGGTMAGAIDMGANAITNATTVAITGVGTQIGAPAAGNDLVNKTYGDANYIQNLAAYLPLVGGTMAGVIDMGVNAITNATTVNNQAGGQLVESRSQTALNMISITQADYDLLAPPVATTLYLMVG